MLYDVASSRFVAPVAPPLPLAVASTTIPGTETTFPLCMDHRHAGVACMNGVSNSRFILHRFQRCNATADAPDWMVLGNDMLVSRQLGLLWAVHLSLPSLMTGYTDRVRRVRWAIR